MNPPEFTSSRDVRAYLRKAFEGVEATSKDGSRGDRLRGFLEAVIGEMAAARGLGVARRAEEYGLSAAGIDWAAVDPTLPGDVYTDLMEGRHSAGQLLHAARAGGSGGGVDGGTLSPNRHRSSGVSTPPPASSRQLAKLPASCLTGEGGKASGFLSREASMLRVLDPAMGGGHFLLAAAEHLAGAGADSEKRWAVVGSLHGADRDPVAVMLARSALWLWAAHPGTGPDDLAGRLVQGDALLDDLWDAGSFDMVIGNPPYASVFTRAGDDPGEREAIRARYETAAGSYDLAVVFVEAAVKLLREGGRCGLVIPNKLLAADYARTLREWMGERAEVEVLAELAETGGFDAGVYPVVMVARKGTPSADGRLMVVKGAQTLERRQADLRGAPGSVWSPVVAHDFEEVRRLWEGDSIPLGDGAHISAGLTVSEAYALREAVIDAPPNLISGEFYPLITTGLIGRGRVTWGEGRGRFLKRTYRRPVVAESVLPVRRREQARGAKIIVAGLGREPRAFYDAGGMLASVGTLIITEADWPLPLLCNWLNSPEVARLYQVLFGGLALSGGYLRFGKRELALLPVPRALPDWGGVQPNLRL